MAIQKIRQVGAAAGRKARQAADQARVLGKHVNKLDRLIGGALSGNAITGSLIAGSNAVVAGLDYFSELTQDLVGGAITHPGAGGGMVAGVANGPVVRRRKAKVTGSRGTIRIVHKELIATVKSSGAHAPYINNGIILESGSSQYIVNSLSRISFPWLASIANSYDCYRFRRLRLVYVPLCPTNTFGRASLMYDLDSSDPLPLDRVGMSNMSCSAEGPIWGGLSLDCRLSNTNKWYYGSDTNTASTAGAYINQGQFAFATYGSGSAIDTGEVYAVYDIELKEPQPVNNILETAHGTAAVVNTQFVTASGMTASATATSITTTFLTPTTVYLVCRAAATASAAPTTTGDITFLENQRYDATTNQVYVLAFRVNLSGSTITLPTLTGLAAWDLIATFPGSGTGTSLIV